MLAHKMHSAIPLIRAVPLCVAAASLRAQAPASPPAPSDSIARAAVALLQSGSPAARAEFIARTVSASARLRDSAAIDARIARLHEQGAPYSVDTITTSGRHRYVRLESPRTARIVVLDIAADRTEAGKIYNVDVLEAHPAALDSADFTLGDDRSSAAIARVADATLTKLASANAFSGTVYVARGDSVILARGYGFANREDSVPNGVHTRFSLASMGKMFTATAIMQLIDRGVLHLDDTLGKVLPDYPSEERRRIVTIRHLLGHTAGFGDLWSTPKKPVPGLKGEMAIAAAVAHAPLLFTPGTRWSYSNEGYAVLAAVIERLSGESYRDYITHHIFEPTGMTETVTRGGSDDIVPHRAVGYRPRADDEIGAEPPRANWSFINGAGSGGAGGGYSTVGDLAKFAKALRTGKLFSSALRDSMWVGRWDIPGYKGQKYGWAQFVMPIGDKVAVGHGGGGTGSGMDNDFKQFTDGSGIVIVLGNAEPPNGVRVTDKLIRMLASASAPRTAASDARARDSARQ